MPWKLKLRRLLRDRFALAALLFLAFLGAGTLAGIYGGLFAASSAAGFSRSTLPQKTDVDRPQRALSAQVSSVSASALKSRETLPEGLKTTSPAQQFAQTAATAESDLIQGLQDSTNLIDVFGAYQAFTGRTVVEDTEESYTVLKISGTDSLTFVRQADLSAVDGFAAQLKRLSRDLAETDTPLLYVQAPQKLAPGTEEDLLPYGTSDNRNQAADLLLQALEDSAVDTLNLRQTLLEAGGSWPDWFYRTDHHWTPQAAFLAFQTIAEKLEDYYQTTPSSFGTRRSKIQIDENYLDPANYSISTLENFFLGSQGKRVGAAYVGTDDFDLITPTFPTLLHYSYSGNDRYGSAEETILFPERVAEKDYYNGNPYTYYSGGDYPFARVTNYYNPSGPKVLLLRDSYACPLTAFLSYACSEVATIDLRYFPESELLTYINWVNPDVVLVMYTASSLSTPELYRFYPETTSSKADLLRFSDRLLPESLRIPSPN